MVLCLTSWVRNLQAIVFEWKMLEHNRNGWDKKTRVSSFDRLLTNQAARTGVSPSLLPLRPNARQPTSALYFHGQKLGRGKRVARRRFTVC
jgi:hypothetical protein